MLRSLFRALLPQAAKTAKPVSHGVKCIDASQLKQVAGGAPKGGWLMPEPDSTNGAPKGGW